MPENVFVLVSRNTFVAPRYFPIVNSSNLYDSFHNHHAVLVRVNRSDHALFDSIHAGSTAATSTVHITIESCSFLNTSGIDFELSHSSLQQILILVTNCTMNGGVVRGHPWGFLHVLGSGVKIQVMTGFWNSVGHTNVFTLSQVTISKNTFKNLSGIEGIGIAVQSIHTGHGDPCARDILVRIEQNTFSSNWGLNYASIIDATHVWLDESESQVCKIEYAEPAIIVSDNFILRNRAEFSRCLGFINETNNSTGYIFLFRRWDIWEECQARDVGKGVVHISGYKNSYFARFANNTITENLAMGLSIIDSHVVFNGSSVISKNYAPYGGGIFMSDRSLMLLVNGTNVIVSTNFAAFCGGGIFVSPMNVKIRNSQSVPQLSASHCFFDFVTNSGHLARNMSLMDLNISVIISSNSAAFSGNSLFVSDLHNCAPPHTFAHISDPMEVFSQVFQLPNYTTEEELATFPQKICSCDPDTGRHINCTLPHVQPLFVFPGQSVDLWLIVMGEGNITLKIFVSLLLSNAETVQDFNSLGKIQTNSPRDIRKQTLADTCDKVTVHPTNIAGEYVLYFAVFFLRNTPMDDSRAALMSYHLISVLDNCPQGYSVINDSSKLVCECHSVLEHYHITCMWETLSFVLPPRYWIGTGSDNHSLLFSTYCLPSHCRDVYNSHEVFLSNMTQQCLHGRVGTLCGQCPEGQSVMLGSYNCETCSSYGIFVVAVYLVAGPLVIVFICLFNWTVSARSSNGLMLYLNIISINSDLLLSSNSFAFVVISWLNFQVGIEMCLFDGMDEFAKTILSFGFPLYLLSLVVLIVILSKCINMHRINKLIGPRITPVLVTVIVLSYSMLSESVLRSLLFAQVCSTDGGCMPVWLLGGSLKYFSSTKHVILASMALTVLFALLIPITLIALIGDLFRRCISNRWYMNFLDTFHSSYRFRWGFWMGVRLLLRVVLLLLKVTVKPEIVWLVTACFSLSLAAVQSVLKPFRHLRFERFSHRLVDEWCSSEENGKTAANYLDISFLVNLTALFLCISFLPESAEAFILLSLIVALIELLLILAYHLVEYSPLWPPLLKVIINLVERMRVFVQSLRHIEKQQQHEESDTNCVLQSLPLVLRAEDCDDENYESSTEEAEDTNEEVEQAEQPPHTN